MKNKKLTQSQGQFVRQHWVGRCGAQVQEEGSFGSKQPPDLERPSFTPVEVRFASRVIHEFPIANPDVVGRRGDDEID